LNGSTPHSTAAPRPVGADTAAILGELGYDPNRTTELARREIVKIAASEGPLAG
jgi:crotonobetainyl-CoA:carnitine CoA-transferase CaiB-like acyl-CoA transferase